MSIEQARELARHGDGRFGVQEHAEAGVVPVDAADASVEQAAVAYGSMGRAVGDFASDPESYRDDFQSLVYAMNQVLSDTLTVEYVVDSDGTEQNPVMIFTDHRTGLSVVDFPDEVTVEDDAESGESVFAAVAEQMLAHRSRLSQKLSEALSAIAAD